MKHARVSTDPIEETSRLLDEKNAAHIVARETLARGSA